MVRNEDNMPKLKNVQLVECLPQAEEKKPYASNADENKARSQAGERCFQKAPMRALLGNICVRNCFIHQTYPRQSQTIPKYSLTTTSRHAHSRP
jgi:hypothetical protein